MNKEELLYKIEEIRSGYMDSYKPSEVENVLGEVLDLVSKLEEIEPIENPIISIPHEVARWVNMYMEESGLDYGHVLVSCLYDVLYSDLNVIPDNSYRYFKENIEYISVIGQGLYYNKPENKYIIKTNKETWIETYGIKANDIIKEYSFTKNKSKAYEFNRKHYAERIANDVGGDIEVVYKEMNPDIEIIKG